PWLRRPGVLGARASWVPDYYSECTVSPCSRLPGSPKVLRHGDFCGRIKPLPRLQTNDIQSLRSLSCGIAVSGRFLGGSTASLRRRCAQFSEPRPKGAL